MEKNNINNITQTRFRVDVLASHLMSQIKEESG